MVRCRECKWWEKYHTYRPALCEAYHRKCLFFEAQEPPWSVMVYGDEEIMTGPDFGCVHGEKEESK